MKLPRALIDDAVFHGPSRLLRFYIWLLCRANWKAGQIFDGQTFRVVDRGQTFVGRAEACRVLTVRGEPFSEKNFRTCLAALEKLALVATKATNRGTIVTLLQYDEWPPADEAGGDKADRQTATSRPAGRTRPARARPAGGCTAATIEEPQEERRTQEVEEREDIEACIRPEGRDTPESLVLQAWVRAGSRPPLMNDRRKRQLREVIAHYKQEDLLQAIALHAKVAGRPGFWWTSPATFDQFFQAKTLDLFVARDESYFSDSKRSSRFPEPTALRPGDFDEFGVPPKKEDSSDEDQ